MPLFPFKSRRRNFFIKKKYQSRFILHFFLLVIAGGALSTGMVVFFSQQTLTSAFDQSRLLVTNTARFLFPLVVYTNLVTLVVISCAVIAVSLFVSHKIAGPLFRFEKDIRRIADGDLRTEIHLRREDQLKEISQDINHMTDSMRKKIETVYSRVESLVDRSEEHQAPEEFVTDMRKLKQKIEKEFQSIRA